MHSSALAWTLSSGLDPDTGMLLAGMLLAHAGFQARVSSTAHLASYDKVDVCLWASSKPLLPLLYALRVDQVYVHCINAFPVISTKLTPVILNVPNDFVFSPLSTYPSLRALHSHVCSPSDSSRSTDHVPRLQILNHREVNDADQRP